MAKRRRTKKKRLLPLPMFGVSPKMGDALIALYDRLRASPNPRHRPISLDSFAKQLFVIHAVASLKALDPRRNIRDDIAKQVAAYFGFKRESSVIEARNSVDPELRAAIELGAAQDINYSLRFADPSAAEKWRNRERRRTDDLTGLESC